MSGKSEQEIASQLRALVGSLPETTVKHLIEQLGRDHPEWAPMLPRLLRKEQETFRPRRAQRLFMSLVEPLLIHDPVLIALAGVVPGVLVHTDVAAMWTVLSEVAFPEILEEAKARLDDMARHVPVETMMHSPEALALRERMREASVKYLRTAQIDRRQMANLLAKVNPLAVESIQTFIAARDERVRIGSSFINQFTDTLQSAPLVVGAIEEIMGRLGAEPAGEESELLIAKLADTEVDLSNSIKYISGVEPDQIAAFPALAVLNRGQRFSFISRYIKYAWGAKLPSRPVLIIALMGHIASCCRVLAHALGDRLATGHLESSNKLHIPEALRRNADMAMERLWRVLEVVRSANIINERGRRQELQRSLNEVFALFGGQVIALLDERVRSYMDDRKGDGVEEDGDVVWLLHFLCTWSRQMVNTGLVVENYDTLQRNLTRHARHAYDAAIAVAAGDTPQDRLAHLVRIESVMQCLGENLVGHFSVLSQNLQKIMLWAIDKPDFSRQEFAMVSAYVNLVKAEAKKSKQWVSLEVADVMARHEKRVTSGFVFRD